MLKSLVIGGIGGQGVQTIGKMLTYAANEAGHYVTFLPSYGGAMRGGNSSCTVMTSDEEIASPTKQKVDYVIALNQDAVNEAKDRLSDTGCLVVNASVARELDGISCEKIIKVPAISIAEQSGSAKAANVVMLGFFAASTGFVPVEIMEKVIMDRFGKKPELVEVNKKAFAAGVAYAKEQS